MHHRYLEVKDGVVPGVLGGPGTDVFKKVSRAAGDYVVIAEEFCAGGCGRVVNHAPTCPFKPKEKNAPRTPRTPPGFPKAKVTSFIMRLMAECKDEIANGTPLRPGRSVVPRAKPCHTFQRGGFMPGRACKNGCKFFPCCATGSEKEKALRREFVADPDVAAWRNGQSTE